MANESLVHDIFASAPFLKTVGIELVGVGAGPCDPRLTVSAAAHQQHGFVHAGAAVPRQPAAALQAAATAASLS
jgi:acyl-coenzyme A thioesterase PaaI-like protein